MYISENHKKQGDFKMTDYAPGMRAVIRDEEWLIKKIEVIKFYNVLASLHW